MIGLNAALGMCRPISAPATRPDEGHRRHRQRRAQVGPHPPVVGDRSWSRCRRSSANLLVASTCAGAAPGSAEQQRRQLDQPAPADDGVDPARAGSPASAEQQRRRSVPGSVTQRSASRRARRRRCRAVEQLVGTASGSRRPRPAARPGCRECGIQIARMPDLLRRRGRPRTAGRRRRPPAAARRRPRRQRRAERLGVRLRPGRSRWSRRRRRAGRARRRARRRRGGSRGSRSCSTARRPGCRASCRPSHSGRTCGSVRVCGSQNPRYAASARWCRSCAGVDPGLAQDVVQRGALPLVASAATPPSRPQDAVGEPVRRSARLGTSGVDRDAVHLAREDAPLLAAGRPCARASACRPSRR